MALDTKNGSVYLSAAALGPLPMPAANNRKPPKHPHSRCGDLPCARSKSGCISGISKLTDRGAA
jgi:hypothetical protein